MVDMKNYQDTNVQRGGIYYDTSYNSNVLHFLMLLRCMSLGSSIDYLQIALNNLKHAER